MIQIDQAPTLAALSRVFRFLDFVITVNELVGRAAARRKHPPECFIEQVTQDNILDQLHACIEELNSVMSRYGRT